MKLSFCYFIWLLKFQTKSYHSPPIRSTVFTSLYFRYTHQKATNRNVSGELNLATVLICIVIVFFVCHIPRVILNFIDVFRSDMSATFDDVPLDYQLTINSHWMLEVANVGLTQTVIHSTHPTQMVCFRVDLLQVCN